MRRLLKWAGIVVGGLVGLIIVAVLVLYLLGSRRVSKNYEFQVEAVQVPTGAAAIVRGRHLIDSIGLCAACHEDNLAGDIIEDDALFGTIVAANLTSGKGGIDGTYNDADYVRAIRHGVAGDGESVVTMPSQYFNRLGDADLGSMIAYLKTLPPVDNELPGTNLGPLGRIITLLDSVLLPATEIDHEAPRPPEPAPGVTVDYGEYLATVCTACHGDNLSGGAVPGESADAPLARNLTPGGALNEWSEADFSKALRTGATPGGGRLDDEYMPWDHFANMTDDEVEAVWLFLKSLPARGFEE